MATLTEGKLDERASRDILYRYYVAMAVPFGIDFATSFVYAAINADLSVLVPMMAVSAAFLVFGVGIGAYFLIRPVQRFLAGDAAFTDIEANIAALPRRSAYLVGALYAPMLALRFVPPHFEVTFGSTIEVAAWVDTVASFVVLTSFNFVLTYFVISAYLDALCEHLFQ